MKKIYCDFDLLSANRGRKHTSIGNMIAHVYFLLNYANKHGLAPVISMGGNLDNLFGFTDAVIRENNEAVGNCYTEIDDFRRPLLLRRILMKITGKFALKQNILDVHSNSYKSYLGSKFFLESDCRSCEDKHIRGHFLHYGLMPSLSVVSNYLAPNERIRGAILEKYSSIQDPTSVAVHFRGGDFRLLLNGLDVYESGVVLPEGYYQKAIDAVYDRIDNPVFHLFSDEMKVLEKYFYGHDYVVHHGDAYEDWMAISMCHNSIQSNSTFSWTASLFVPGFSVQPKNGLAYNNRHDLGSSPYGFECPGAIVIG